MSFLFCIHCPLFKDMHLYTNLNIHLFLLQFLKQMYVLVLGLDVLGNPFGLIRGLSEGVEAFFYEPFQVQKKHFLILDFTEGLAAMVLLLLLLNDDDDDNSSSSKEYYLHTYSATCCNPHSSGV